MGQARPANAGPAKAGQWQSDRKALAEAGQRPRRESEDQEREGPDRAEEDPESQAADEKPCRQRATGSRQRGPGGSVGWRHTRQVGVGDEIGQDGPVQHSANFDERLAVAGAQVAGHYVGQVWVLEHDVAVDSDGGGFGLIGSAD